MRTTGSFRVFPDNQAERGLARARWLAREGRRDEALDAYRQALHDDPISKVAWAEGFDILRRSGRIKEALRWAREAAGQLGEGAFALALEGAALIELARYRDALQSLERAVEHDPDLALIWHELGYAAYKLREPTRALAALDRAFALEPHTETLMLRGRVLLAAGQHDAAEVAFQAATQTATYDEQRTDIEALHRMAQRYALYESEAPAQLRPAQSVFAQSGTVVLASAPGTSKDIELVEGLVAVSVESGWSFEQLVIVGESTPLTALVAGLGIPPECPESLDAERIPLVATARLDRTAPTGWIDLMNQIRSTGTGLLFALESTIDMSGEADVIGRPASADGCFDLDRALSEARHPAASLGGRVLAKSSLERTSSG